MYVRMYKVKSVQLQQQMYVAIVLVHILLRIRQTLTSYIVWCSTQPPSAQVISASTVIIGGVTLTTRRCELIAIPARPSSPYHVSGTGRDGLAIQTNEE